MEEFREEKNKGTAEQDIENKKPRPKSKSPNKTQSGLEILKKQKDDTLICPGCNKQYKKSRTLQSHMKNDCGKTYSCPMCLKTFKYMNSFCRHKKKCKVHRREMRIEQLKKKLNLI
jgi:hypothetical protein